MPECVSCGKEIPAGRFFCDDCYVKMKGRRGTLKEVSKTPAGEGEMPDGAAAEKGEQGGEASPPAESTPAKKASGTLTPTSGKKVVSIKPDVDRSGRDKGKVGKKRFTVTISFSERTYAALGRLRRKGRSEAGVPGEGEAVTPVKPVKEKRRAKGPHGRPQLKAVKIATAGKGEPERGLWKWIGYRDRARDRRDIAAIATATVSFVLVIVLSFTGWVKLSWSPGETGGGGAVSIKGIDLGIFFYISIAIMAVAYLYMVATWVFKEPLVKVDYGVTLLIGGVAYIPFIYASIASTERLFDAAYRILGYGGGAVPANYQRSTLLPAYIAVLAGAAFAISGLMRLSERKAGSAHTA